MNDEIDKRVDEDWKKRAQLEKMELDAQQRARPSGKGSEKAQTEKEGSLFSMFVQTLVAQAAVMLGLEPDPMTGAAQPNLEQARYLIDVLGMLEEKTRGNLSPDEARQLKVVLHELRMAFVEVSQGGHRGMRP